MKKKSVKKGKSSKAIKAFQNNSGLTLQVKPIAVGAEIPVYAVKSDVGFDLRANEAVKFFPGEQKKVRTGLIIKIPDNHVGLIRDRAGIVTQMNIHTAAGTIDPAYRGEISIILVNLSEETQFVEKGMRIAQMIIVPVVKPEIVEVEKVQETERGDKGFGSTGLKELKWLGKELKKLGKSK